MQKKTRSKDSASTSRSGNPKLLNPGNPARELYAILGLTEAATTQNIRDQWRRIAAKHHPDANGGRSSELFIKALHAHDILVDPEKRAAYDASGVDPGTIPNPDSGAKDAILQVVMQLVDGAITNPHMDILGSLRTTFNNELLKKTQELGQIERAVKSYAKTRSNIETHWKGAEGVKAAALNLIDDKSSAAETSKTDAASTVAIIKRAIEILSDVNFVVPMPDVPAAPRQGYATYGIGTGGGFSGSWL